MPEGLAGKSCRRGSEALGAPGGQAARGPPSERPPCAAPCGRMEGDRQGGSTWALRGSGAQGEGPVLGWALDRGHCGGGGQCWGASGLGVLAGKGPVHRLLWPPPQSRGPSTPSGGAAKVLGRAGRSASVPRLPSGAVEALQGWPLSRELWAPRGCSCAPHTPGVQAGCPGDVAAPPAPTVCTSVVPFSLWLRGS